jgi:hypothetical protein
MHRLKTYRIALAMAVLALTLGYTEAASQSFTLETYNQGIDVVVPESVFGNGISTYDFNKDGWDDLTFCNNGDSARFYLNNAGVFERIDLDTDYPITGDSKQILWIDYDNDGDLDMSITNLLERIVLLRNDGDLSFTDVSEDLGLLSENSKHYGAAWGDVDNDGDLDLYVTKYHNPDTDFGAQYRNQIYRNDGVDGFVELAQSAGVSNGVSATFQAIFYDYNLDGYQDIFLINDRSDQENYLYRNNGDWTFSDVSADTGMDIGIDAMCIAVADYDQDGDLDIYISNTFDNYLMKFENGGYVNLANEFGVTGTGISWGALWIDHDLDMDLDLFVSNTGNVGSIELLNSFYENLEVFFLEDYEEFGLADDVHGTYCVAAGDFNNDGHPDFVEGNNAPSDSHLYMNSGTTNKHWAKISLEGTVSNRDGIGSWIRVYCADICQVKYTFAGENYLSQDSQRKIFGLNNHSVIDSVEVAWLSGLEETYYNLPADSTYHFIEGSGLTNEISAIDGTTACFGEFVALDAGNYESYLWSNGDTTQTTEILESGMYNVTVVDWLGFTLTSDSVEVTIVPMLEVEATLEDVHCYGDSTGSILLEISDEIEVISIDWSNDDTTASIENLSAGIYNVVIQFNENCIESLDFVINEGPEIQIFPFVTNVLCNGDSTGGLDLEITGGSPPFLIDYNGINPSEIPGGEYAVIVEDSLGCAQTATVVVQEPEVLTSIIFATNITDSTEGSASIEIEGGTAPYFIEWSTGATTAVISPLDLGDYWVEVTDSVGCSLFEIFTITSVFDSNVLAHDIQIHPVPFQEQLNITNQRAVVVNARIYSGSGQVVDHIKLSPGQNTLNTSTWAKGIYIIDVFHDGFSSCVKVLKD